MNTETVQTLIKLLEAQLSKPDGIVVAAIITVVGMIGVGILTAVIQWVVTRRMLQDEYRRLRLQLKSEFESRQYELWQERFIDARVKLLEATDPETNKTFDSSITVPLIHKAQLILDLRNPIHRQVNELITKLGMAVNGWEPGHNFSSISKLHGILLEKSREIVAKP